MPVGSVKGVSRREYPSLLSLILPYSLDVHSSGHCKSSGGLRRLIRSRIYVCDKPELYESLKKEYEGQSHSPLAPFPLPLVAESRANPDLRQPNPTVTRWTRRFTYLGFHYLLCRILFHPTYRGRIRPVHEIRGHSSWTDECEGARERGFRKVFTGGRGYR